MSDTIEVTKDLGCNDVVIQRVRNGWVLTSVDYMSGLDGDELVESIEVYEDTDGYNPGKNGEADSLANLLWSAFTDYTQAKREAGIVIESRASRTQEESEANTDEMKVLPRVQ